MEVNLQMKNMRVCKYLYCFLGERREQRLIDSPLIEIPEIINSSDPYQQQTLCFAEILKSKDSLGRSIALPGIFLGLHCGEWFENFSVSWFFLVHRTDRTCQLAGW